MIFKQKVIYLSVAIFIGIVFFILGMVFSPDSIAGRAFKHPVFPDFYKKNVTQISIKYHNQEIILENLSGQNWQVKMGTYFLPADARKIDAFLTQFLSFKKLKRVTSSKNNWHVFSLEEGNGYSVSLTDGVKRRTVELIVGKNDSVTGGDFFREAGNDSVWLSDNSIIPYLYLDKDQWSDLFLLGALAEKDTIATIKADINIVYSDNTKIMDSYTLTHSTIGTAKPQWVIQMEKPFKLDQQKILVLIRNFVNVKAKSYVTDKNDNFGFEIPQARIVLLTDNDRKINLLIGRKEGGSFYIKNDISGFVFLIDEWAVKQILQSSSDLAE